MRVAYIKDGKTEFKDLPKTYKNMPVFDKRAESVWNENGFYVIEYPALAEGEKYDGQNGELVGNEYVIKKVPKTPEELEAEKIQKQQAEKEKIKQKLIDKYIEGEVIKDPVTNINYFEEWKFKTEGYPIAAKVQYKAKPFENLNANNTLAPDKGGWREMKAI